MSSYLTGAQNEENMQTTTEVTCVDTTPNCSTYGPQRCLSHTWANVECKKYCGICSKYDRRQSVTYMTYSIVIRSDRKQTKQYKHPKILPRSKVLSRK